MSTTLSVCQWEWCRSNFASQDALVEHVMQVHIVAAVPIKRKNLPLERRAEEGASMEGACLRPIFTYIQ